VGGITLPEAKQHNREGRTEGWFYYINSEPPGCKEIKLKGGSR